MWSRTVFRDAAAIKYMLRSHLPAMIMVKWTENCKDQRESAECEVLLFLRLWLNTHKKKNLKISTSIQCFWTNLVSLQSLHEILQLYSDNWPFYKVFIAHSAFFFRLLIFFCLPAFLFSPEFTRECLRDVSVNIIISEFQSCHKSVKFWRSVGSRAKWTWF